MKVKQLHLFAGVLLCTLSASCDYEWTIISFALVGAYYISYAFQNPKP